MAKKDPFQQLMANIDWTRWFQVIIPVMQPIVIFGSWLAFSKFDKRADAVSKLIALAEPIPAIDLNVPKPVVLASLFHSTDEALKILEEVITFLKDMEIPSAPEIIEGIKDGITEPIAGAVEEALPDDPAFKQALADCVMNAKKNLPFGSYYIFGVGWIVSCMAQKGFQVSKKMIEDAYF